MWDGCVWAVSGSAAPPPVRGVVFLATHGARAPPPSRHQPRAAPTSYPITHVLRARQHGLLVVVLQQPVLCRAQRRDARPLLEVGHAAASAASAASSAGGAATTAAACTRARGSARACGGRPAAPDDHFEAVARRRAVGLAPVADKALQQAERGLVLNLVGVKVLAAARAGAGRDRGSARSGSRQGAAPSGRARARQARQRRAGRRRARRAHRSAK